MRWQRLRIYRLWDPLSCTRRTSSRNAAGLSRAPVRVNSGLRDSARTEDDYRMQETEAEMRQEGALLVVLETGMRGYMS